MKRAFVICSLTLAATLAFGLSFVPDPWSGFWRIEQISTEKTTVYHLWVSNGGRLHLYDDAWKSLSLTPSSEAQGEALKLSQYFKGGQIVWAGQLDGESVKGDWEFLHPQYRVKGDFSGTRFSRVRLPAWSPLKAAHANTSPEKVLNLARLLTEQSTSPEQFQNYWTGTFVPGFLPFFLELPEQSEVWARAEDIEARKASDGLARGTGHGPRETTPQELSLFP